MNTKCIRNRNDGLHLVDHKKNSHPAVPLVCTLLEKQGWHFIKMCLQWLIGYTTFLLFLPLLFTQYCWFLALRSVETKLKQGFLPVSNILALTYFSETSKILGPCLLLSSATKDLALSESWCSFAFSIAISLRSSCSFKEITSHVIK